MKEKDFLFERATFSNISCNFMSLYGDNCTAVPDIFPEDYNMDSYQPE
jgi:hypothetical protein